METALGLPFSSGSSAAREEDGSMVNRTVRAEDASSARVRRVEATLGLKIDAEVLEIRARWTMP